MSTFEILDSSHEILPEPKRGSGNNAPVQQAERIAWALTRVLEAIDRMAKAPHEPALVLAVVARRREYQNALEAPATAARVAAQRKAQADQRGRHG